MAQNFLPWSTSMPPWTKEQALAVLADGQDGLWLDPFLRVRIVECLTNETPGPTYPRLWTGGYIIGWAFNDAEGAHGGYESVEAAKRAYLDSLTPEDFAKLYRDRV